MLKRKIKYTDLNGDEQEDIFYFNLSGPEIIEMEVEYKQGFRKMLQDIIDAKDNQKIVKVVKELILKSYGVRSEDGKRFIKSEELSKEFSQSEAYVVLFMEFATDAEASANFIKGIVPKELAGQIDQDKPVGAPPTLPPPPTN